MFQGTKHTSDSVIMSIPDTESADVPPTPPSTSEEDMDTTPVLCSTPIQLLQQHETFPLSPILFVEQPTKKTDLTTLLALDSVTQWPCWYMLCKLVEQVTQQKLTPRMPPTKLKDVCKQQKTLESIKCKGYSRQGAIP